MHVNMCYLGSEAATSALPWLLHWGLEQCDLFHIQSNSLSTAKATVPWTSTEEHHCSQEQLQGACRVVPKVINITIFYTGEVCMCAEGDELTDRVRRGDLL